MNQHQPDLMHFPSINMRPFFVPIGYQVFLNSLIRKRLTRRKEGDDGNMMTSRVSL